MARSAADDIFEGLAEAYDELRVELLTVNDVPLDVRLLQKIAETGTYRELLELTIGHYLRYEENQAQAELRVARIDSTFTTAFNDMTDFSANGVIYNVDDRDKETPKGSKFYYQMFGVRTNLTYVPA